MEIKKKDLVPIYNFLDSMKLKPQASRARSNLFNSLQVIIEQVDKEQQQLKADFNDKELIDENFKLLNETSIVNFEYVEQEEILKEALNEYDYELSGADAYAYNLLFDLLNQSKNNEEIPIDVNQ